MRKGALIVCFWVTSLLLSACILDVGETSTLAMQTPAYEEDSTATPSISELTVTPSLQQTVASEPSPTLADVPSSVCISEIFLLDGDFEEGIAFSPDSQFLAFATGTTLYLMDTATWTTVWEVPHNASLLISMLFSPDGRTLVAAAVLENGYVIRFWDVSSGTIIRDINTEQNEFPSDMMAFSPDMTLLGASDYSGNVMVWDLSNGRLINKWEAGLAAGKNSNLVFRDNTTLVFGYGGRLKLYNVFSDEEIEILPINGAYGVSPETGIVLGDGPVWDGSSTYVYDGATQELLYVIEHHSVRRGWAFSADGTYVLFTTENKHIQIFDVTTKTLVCETLLPAHLTDYHIAISSDGRLSAMMVKDDENQLSVIVWKIEP